MPSHVPSIPVPQPSGPGGALPDEEVARRVLAGETALFEVLMRRHNARVYRTVRSILRDEAEAEEAMQQAYVRAYLHLGQFTGAARFSTWLVRIAVNEALMHKRKTARLQVVAEPDALTEGRTMEAEVPTPEERAERRELAALLERAVDGLPESYRSVFVLREVEGLSTAETAEVLGLNEALVKTRLHRAKAQVRDALFETVGASASELFPFPATRCDRVVAAVLARLAALTPSSG